jgi:hypothetical protein
MIKAAVLRHRQVQCAFAGMAEGRMAEIMGQCEGFGEVLIEAKLTGNGARDLRHFEAVGEPRPVVVPFVIEEDLRLVGEAAEGRGVQDPVAVALERAAGRAIGFGKAAATGWHGAGSVRSERTLAGLQIRAVI